MNKQRKTDCVSLAVYRACLAIFSCRNRNRNFCFAFGPIIIIIFGSFRAQLLYGISDLLSCVWDCLTMWNTFENMFQLGSDNWFEDVQWEWESNKQCMESFTRFILELILTGISLL